MCVSHEMRCGCGQGLAGFNFKESVLHMEVISKLYCPKCSTDIKLNPETMVADNGWVIEYNIDIARLQSNRLNIDPADMTPEFIFDEGYCTWRGAYPTDHIDSVAEKTEISKLAKVNPKKYMDDIRQWATSRMERLNQEGWRKARE